MNVQMSVQASLTYLCPFNVCTFGVWLSAILLYKNRSAKRVLQGKREAELLLVKTHVVLVKTQNLVLLGKTQECLLVKCALR